MPHSGVPLRTAPSGQPPAQRGPAHSPGPRAHSRGQSIVELALVLPVVLLIVLISLDLGRAYLGWVVLNNASRAGADYAAIHPGAWGTPGDPVRRDTYEALV